MSEIESKRMTAGLLGIFLGGWGIHKFYLGMNKPAVIQLIATFVTCGAAGLVGFIEGIIYITKSDEEFIQLYQVDQKEWF